MSRDLYMYSCYECRENFDSYRPQYKCNNCGSMNIEIEHTVLDDSHDYSGR